MIKHMLIMIWKNKHANVFLISEIVCIFVLVSLLVNFISLLMSNYAPPLFPIEKLWLVQVTETSKKHRTEANTALISGLNGFEDVEHVIPLPMNIFSSRPISMNIEHNGLSYDVPVVLMPRELCEILPCKTVEGRWFNDSDTEEEITPIVINEHFRETILGRANPIGATIDCFGFGGNEQNRTFKVIGVFKGSRQFDGRGKLSSFGVIPSRDTFNANRRLDEIVIKASRDDNAFASVLMQHLTTVQPSFSYDIVKLKNNLKTDADSQSFILILIIIAFLALIGTALLGIVSILWRHFIRRTQEMGIRRANGATIYDICLHVIGETLVVTGIALFVSSLILWYILNHGLAFVYSPSVMLSIVNSSIIGLMLICCIYPCIVLIRISPAEALRSN